MATTEISRDIDKLKGDMDEIRKDVASIAHALRDVGATKKQQAFSRAEELTGKVRQRAENAGERMSHEVEERPLASILAAFGIGFLLGKLFD